MTSTRLQKTTADSLLRRLPKGTRKDDMVPVTTDGPRLYRALTGVDVGVRTLQNYVRIGRKGVRLQTVVIAGQRHISARTLAEFIASVSQRPDGRGRKPQR